ncbi:hypothetical protein QMK19_11735 [Streptomyces sp. H10-C2]|uniref:hypothetical protein n=1 Tax=unclassified Streptomyces TaxID=2593676 RepID=UPI0024B89AA4|nr:MULTISPECIES: hypothetical protein [unclassified Streptomyces]MDJ0347197.1 hypothetical protein [Streptomyces sp. PH10-H1]MDJ0370330.1 hypothetical protein [Streptomyces sp. H10-C2]
MTGGTIPFTAVDESADLLERRGEPNLILLELRLAGRLDADRLRAAVGDALRALPMARARRASGGPWRRRSSWEIPGGPDLDPLTVAPAGAVPDTERRRMMDTPVPLSTSPTLRLRLLPSPGTPGPGADASGTGGHAADGGDRLLIAAHHALFDAISCLGFLTSVSHAYNGTQDPVAVPDETRTPESPAAPDAAHAPHAELFPRAVRVARAAAPGDGGYGCVLTEFDADRTAALAAAARRRAATVNDLLITALALTVTRWNAAHRRPSTPVRITMPINARAADRRFDGIRNHSRLTSISSAAGEPAELLASVADQTRRAKRTAAPAGGPAAQVLGSPALPRGLRRTLVGPVRAAARLLADTTMLSNLGRLPDPPAFDGAGNTTGLWLAAPAPMPRGLSVSALTVFGRLHLAVRHRYAVLGAPAAAAFTAAFTEALDELAALPASSHLSAHATEGRSQ